MKKIGQIKIGNRQLSIQDVVAVSSGAIKVTLEDGVKNRLDKGSKQLAKAVRGAIRAEKEIGNRIRSLEREVKNKEVAAEVKKLQLDLKKKMIYGVTTGFGALKKNYCENEEDARKLQRNLILSHVCGVGEYLDAEIVRVIMLLKAHHLTSGRSGVRFELVRRLVNILNAGIVPLIPEQGSVGASGDLAPLAHMALAVIGEQAPSMKSIRYKGQKFASIRGAKRKFRSDPGLQRIEDKFDLDFKEGLALLNGTEVLTAIAVLSYQKAVNLVNWADAIGAITLESILGSSRAFDEIVFSVYQHKGAKKSAENVRRMIASSTFVNQNESVHDPYSLRCIPQVHGAVRDNLEFIGRMLSEHLNSITDDPIFFSPEKVRKYAPLDSIQERLHFEEGHFHGEPIAFAMDLLGIVTAELGSISERRIQMLLDPNHNQGLPACLVQNHKGLNTGYMLAQYTAASLVSENKILAHPASVDSIPTSANAEDHVSMGTIAARKAKKIVEHIETILAIELLCSTEALSFRLGAQNLDGARMKGKPGRLTAQLYQKVRGKGGIPLLRGEDRVIYPDIQRAKRILREESVIKNEAKKG
jgi:histidine ammonia-lyase